MVSMTMNGKAATLVAGLLLASLLTPLALGLAGASEGDETELAEDELSDERVVEVEDRGDEIEMRSLGPEGDRVRMRIRADEGEVRFDFRPPGANATEIQLELEFEALVEYLDGNHNGRLDANETEVQEVRVDDLAFAPPAVEAVDGGMRLELAYTRGDLVFRLVFWAFGNETVLNGTLVKPTEVKFDIYVERFPFEREDSGLAVLLDLKTEVEPRHATNATVESLAATAGEYEAFFGWSTSAEVDGRTVPVNATVLEVETELEDDEFEVERSVALAYPQGIVIVHHPVLGIAPAAAGGFGLGTTTSLLAYGAMAVAAALVVLYLVARRRR